MNTSTTVIKLPTGSNRAIEFEAEGNVPVVPMAGERGVHAIGLEFPTLEVGINSDSGIAAGEKVARAIVTYAGGRPSAVGALEACLAQLDARADDVNALRLLAYASACDGTGRYSSEHLDAVARLLGVGLNALQCVAVVTPNEDGGWLSASVAEAPDA